MQHSYPCCWRHKTPIIFRATPQWFVSMDQKGLRAQSLKEIKGVQWIPDWGGRVSSRWLLTVLTGVSLVSVPGVPMSLFVHKDTEELHPRTLELMEEVAKRVEVDGIRAWWDLDAKEILGDEADQYVKVPDTLDVWFDSDLPTLPLLMCVRNLPVTQRTCIWKVLTNTVAGSCLP